jgi:hypothetical protein
MSNKTKQALATYLRAFAACAVAGAMVIGKSPLEYTSTDVLALANTVWVSFLPVLARAFNSKDAAYGVGSSTAAKK